MIALDSQIEKSPSFKVGTQWAGLIAKNSGLFCSPANKSKSVNLKSTFANLKVASQARAKIKVVKLGYPSKKTNLVVKLGERKVPFLSL